MFDRVMKRVNMVLMLLKGNALTHVIRYYLSKLAQQLQAEAPISIFSGLTALNMSQLACDY